MFGAKRIYQESETHIFFHIQQPLPREFNISLSEYLSPLLNFFALGGALYSTQGKHI